MYISISHFVRWCRIEKAPAALSAGRGCTGCTAQSCKEGGAQLIPRPGIFFLMKRSEGRFFNQGWVPFLSGPPDPIGDGPQFPTLGLLDQLLAVPFQKARLFSAALSVAPRGHLFQPSWTIPIDPSVHALVTDPDDLGHLAHRTALSCQPEVQSWWSVSSR